MKTTKNISEEYLDKIISVAYGDAGLINRIKIFFNARSNAEVKKILEEYRETAREVHQMALEKFEKEIPVNGPKVNNWLLTYFNLFFRRPVLSTAMALMIIAGVTGYLIINNNNSSIDGYSKTELAIAENQAKESFAIVASIMDKTEDKLKNEVFKEKINKPLKKTVTIVNTYL